MHFFQKKIRKAGGRNKECQISSKKNIYFDRTALPLEKSFHWKIHNIQNITISDALFHKDMRD